MEDFDSQIILAEKSLSSIRGIFDRNKIKEKLENLNKEISKETFWKDNNKVKKL